jgi:hypothetical protein
MKLGGIDLGPGSPPQPVLWTGGGKALFVVVGFYYLFTRRS